MRGYDAWITREPPGMDYEPPVYHCARCRSFLKHAPEGEREWVKLSRCDGEAKVYTEQRHDERTLAILGEEYRDATYSLAFMPDCGSKHGSHEQEGDGEIGPEEAPGWKHAPHFYAEPYGWHVVELRTCARCGYLNEHPVI